MSTKQTTPGLSPVAARNLLDRRKFLKLGVASVAGLAILGTSEARPALANVDWTPAPRLGISKNNSATRNRRNLLRALTNSGKNVHFPRGEYRINNSGDYIVIRRFRGRLRMAPGARFVFTDNTTRGLMFERGAGARFYGLKATFARLPRRRVNSEECILFWETSGTVVRNAWIRGSAAAGILFGHCREPRVYGATIGATQADGLHFANCRNARAVNIRTYNTGDDGLAFLNYRKGPDYSGGYARNVRVRNSHTRGITVIGQRDVRIVNFNVRRSHSSGIHVAQEGSFNTRTPSNVVYYDGVITGAGTMSKDGRMATNRSSIFHDGVRNTRFVDIISRYPGREHVKAGPRRRGVRMRGIRRVG